MNPEQQEQFTREMKEHLAETVRLVVNGKIDKIDMKLDDYITEDEAWKIRAEPVVKAFENTSWLFQLFIKVVKVLSILAGGVAAAAAAIAAVKTWFK